MLSAWLVSLDLEALYGTFVAGGVEHGDLTFLNEGDLFALGACIVYSV
jgi:hypothetical protein